MIEKNSTTHYKGLMFTQEDYEEDGERRTNIYVENSSGRTSSLACVMGEEEWSSHFEPISKRQVKICEEVYKWAVEHDLY